MEIQNVGQFVLDGLINPVLNFFVACMVVYFLYGMMSFIFFLRISPNDEKRKVGRSHMLYGLIGLLIMFSATQVLTWFQEIFGPLTSTLSK